MTRETKLGAMVAGTFLVLVGGVMATKYLGKGPAPAPAGPATEVAQVPAPNTGAPQPEESKPQHRENSDFHAPNDDTKSGLILTNHELKGPPGAERPKPDESPLDNLIVPPAPALEPGQTKPVKPNQEGGKVVPSAEQIYPLIPAQAAPERKPSTQQATIPLDAVKPAAPMVPSAEPVYLELPAFDQTSKKKNTTSPPTDKKEAGFAPPPPDADLIVAPPAPRRDDFTSNAKKDIDKRAGDPIAQIQSQSPASDPANSSQGTDNRAKKKDGAPATNPITVPPPVDAPPVVPPEPLSPEKKSTPVIEPKATGTGSPAPTAANPIVLPLESPSVQPPKNESPAASPAVKDPAHEKKSPPATLTIDGSPAKSTPATITGVTPKTDAPMQQNSFDEDLHSLKPNETYGSMSKQYYNSNAYAAALQHYNRDHPGQADYVRIPPIWMLEKSYSNDIGGNAAPTRAVNYAPPAAAPIPGNAEPFYTVAENGELLADIARKTLGSDETRTWQRIVDLNPQLNAAKLIPGGTRLRMPDGARPQ